MNGQRTREIPGRHRLREGFCLHLPSRNSLRCRWRDDGSPTACATQQSHDVHPGAARGHASACACPSPRQSAQSDSLRGRRSQSLTGLVAVRDFQFNPLVTLVVALVRMKTPVSTLNLQWSQPRTGDNDCPTVLLLGVVSCHLTLLLTLATMLSQDKIPLTQILS